ncbi:MAG: hypothetical protein MZV70_71310 [Desulfobacterales bacterium]|nr:hypothetical protein [Desulfobacterales bacterium]
MVDRQLVRLDVPIMIARLGPDAGSWSSTARMARLGRRAFFCRHHRVLHGVGSSGRPARRAAAAAIRRCRFGMTSDETAANGAAFGSAGRP